MKNYKTTAGISLIEIMVAVLLLALAAIPIYRTLSFGASKEIENEKIAIANRILESFKNEIMGMPFEVLQTEFSDTSWQTIGADFPNVFNALMEAQKKYKDFEFSGQVRQVEDAVVPTMEFKAEVNWTKNDGEKRDKPEKIFFIKVEK